MAIALGKETVELTGEERTWRIEIFSERGEDPRFVAHRERVWVRADGSAARVEREGVAAVRRLSELKDKAVAGVKGSELALVLEAWADALRTEDLSAVAAVPAIKKLK